MTAHETATIELPVAEQIERIRKHRRIAWFLTGVMIAGVCAVVLMLPVWAVANRDDVLQQQQTVLVGVCDRAGPLPPELVDQCEHARRGETPAPRGSGLPFSAPFAAPERSPVSTVVLPAPPAVTVTAVPPAPLPVTETVRAPAVTVTETAPTVTVTAAPPTPRRMPPPPPPPPPPTTATTTPAAETSTATTTATAATETVTATAETSEPATPEPTALLNVAPTVPNRRPLIKVWLLRIG